MIEERKNKQGFYSDFARIQKISGFIALSAVIITVFVASFFPIEKTNVKNIIYIGIFSGIFAVIYYTIPRLYLNLKYVILPDLVFTFAIAFSMYNLGKWGFLYIIYFLIIIVIDAFAYDRKNFIIATTTVCLAIIFTNVFQIGSDYIPNMTAFYYNAFFELYWVLSLAILIRLLAKESLDLRKEKREIEGAMILLEKEKREIVSLFNSLNDIIISFDKQNKINFLNKAATDAFSLNNFEKMIGKSAPKNMVIISDSKPIYITKILEKITQRVFKENVYIRNKSFLTQYNVTITPLYDKDKNYEGAIVYMHNLTKEEELERKKIEFASIASHELRTPLAVIEGYLHLLLTDKCFKYDKETKDYLTLLSDTSKDLISLSANILAITKIEDNSLELKIEEFDLSHFIKEISAGFVKKAEEKGLIFKIDIQNKISKIKTDREKLKEILENLFDNAIKFTDKGSIKVNISLEGKNIIVAVKDTGIGIKRMSRDKIFQKFYRDEEWSTRKTGGTGLGLYISKILAEKINGKIEYVSEKGKGSTFILSFLKSF